MKDHVDSSTAGFALPLVILLLLVGTIGGATVASVAMHQARGAGSLQASVIALHMAESGAAYVVNGLASGELDWPGDGTYTGADLAQLGDASLGAPGYRHGLGRWWVDSVTVNGDRATLWVTGQCPGPESAPDRIPRRTLRIEYKRGSDTVAFPFGTAVLGCNGIHLQGSAEIDSYDSRSGPYSPATARANANVTTLNGDLTLPGDTRIRGDVHVNGNLNISGSSQVQGEVLATGNISFGGGTPCPTESVRAGGSVYLPYSSWCSGQLGMVVQNTYVPPPPQSSCDVLNVNDFVDGQLAAARAEIDSYQNGNFSGWQPLPITFDENPAFASGLSVGATNEVAFESGTVDQVFVNGDLELGGSGKIRIKAPSTPGSGGHMRIFVDGDVKLGGGAQFIIEPGASVELIVTGTVDIGGGLQNFNSAPTTVINGEVRPSIAIYSSFAGANGVKLGGSVDMFASVYAPNTTVNIAGSGAFYGSVIGGVVNLTGTGDIHFDEALSDANVGTIGDDSSSRVTTWIEILGLG